MKKKIGVVIAAVFFVSGLSLLCYTEEEMSAGMRELAEETSSIASEIDEIIREIKSEPDQLEPDKTEEKPAPFQNQVITPEQISRTVIPEQFRNQTVSLEFEQADLESVVRTLADTAGINIMVDPELKAKPVDLHLKQVPVAEALSLLYSAYSLGSYKVGTSLFLTTREKIEKQTMITRIIKLKNVSAKEVEPLIKDVVKVANISEETNTVVITGNPEDIAKVEAILERVDVAQPQVMLEAKIIEISSNYLKNLGVNWSNSVNLNFSETKRPAGIEDPMPGSENVFRIFGIARDALTFNATVNMLEQENKAKILSNPKIATMNNKSAEINVIDQIPYTVTEVINGVDQTELRFIEPGIRLKITPSILENEFVVITIEPEVSNQSGTVETGKGDYPIVTKRTATAHVRVKNGQPFIMGGLLDKQEAKVESKVPFLGDIPFLGVLFRNKASLPSEKELIISVTPTIVRGNI